jgi:hypothetical protein
VAHAALCAGEDGVVVGEDQRSGPLGSERGGVDRRETRDEPVGWARRDQLLHREATPLRGHGQSAVFDERPVVDQIVDVLARGPLPGLAPLRDRIRPPRVHRGADPRAQLGQLRPDRPVVAAHGHVRYYA